MKKNHIIGSLLFFFLTTTSFAGLFSIPHIAENNWQTTITVINPTDFQQEFTLKKYNDNGEEELSLVKICNGKSNTILTNQDFGFNGAAIIEAAISKQLFVKLSYRFENSQSLSEFLVDEDHFYEQSVWIIPNPNLSYFSWFGLAMFNASKSITPTTITLKAYKEGTLIDTKTISLERKKKFVKLSNDIWDGLNYSDIDMVVVESDGNCPAPLVITGNDTQDRHLFFQGVKATVESETKFSIPHIAENDWTTSLSFYNNNGQTESVTTNSWNENGEEFLVNNSVEVPPYSSITLEAGNSGASFPYSGNGSVLSNSINNPLLSYRFGDSQSVCSFFLKGKTGVKWLIANNSESWFNWMGIALNNPNEHEISITIDAYKGGKLKGSKTFSVAEHKKFLKLSSEIWNENNEPLMYQDIDMIIVNSDYPTYQPIAIIGNNAQDRHLFFSGQNMLPANETIFVDKNFEGESDGSVLKPFKTIQDGVTNANNGDIVKITTNQYTENLTTDKAVSLIGGFESNNYAKPMENSYTTITATSNDQDVVRITPEVEDSFVIFSNFDISNGKRGVYINSFGDVVVTNCNIHNNGIENLTSQYLGGGLFTKGYNTLIANCTISNNIASIGGGIFLTGWHSLFTNNNVHNNTANYNYGDKNFAGGVFAEGISHCIISNNNISDNSVGSENNEGFGGGLVLKSDGKANNNRILNNFAYSGGGGIALIKSIDVEIANSLICNNKLAETGTKGAGIFITPENMPSVNYGTQKTAFNKKAIHISNGVILTLSTVAFNTVEGEGSGGGNGIYAYYDGSYTTGGTAKNCIFYGNSNSDFGTNSEEDVFKTNYCLTNQHIGGIGNVSGDPLFANTENYDFHLKSEVGRYDETTQSFIEDTVSSHCIDKGNPDSDYSLEPESNGNLINLGYYGNTIEASKSPEKSDEDNMIDNAFRIDIQNIDVTFDIYTDTNNINASATMTFYMRPGYTKPVFHFTPLSSGKTITSISLDEEILDKTNENDLKIVTFNGSTQKAVEIQRDLEENKLYTLKITYPANYAMDIYKKIWTWTNVNDITGVGNEYFFPTINFPSELAKHKITFNVHGGGYSFISSGQTTYNTIDDGQQFIIEPIRDVASYTIMFVLIPADDVIAGEQTIDGVNVKIMAYKGGASINTGFSYLESWLPKLHTDLGEFPMPEGLSVFLTTSGGGMEYYGATITSLGALKHEVFHMYYACSTINKTYRDSWLDEAINEWYEFHHSPISSTYTSNIVSGRTPIGVGFDTRAYNKGANIIGAVAEELGGVTEMIEFLNYLHNNYFFRPYTTLDFVENIKLYGNVDMYDNFIQWVFNNETQNKSTNQVDEKHKVDMTPPDEIRKKY